MKLTGKKIAVLGLMNDGLEMIRALHHRGAQVDGFGIPPSETESKKITTQLKGIARNIIWNSISSEALLPYDLIIRTPGAGIFQEALDQAKNNSVKILSDLEMACQFMKAPIIAVTGTNGKTTTTALIQILLQEQGFSVATVGGEFNRYGEVVSNEKDFDYFLIEVSSQRLAQSQNFHPYIAVLLNIYPAHGDRHAGGIPEYIESKGKIFDQQTDKDFLIFSGTGVNVRELIRQRNPVSQKIMFSMDQPVNPPGIYREKQNFIWVGPKGETESYSFARTPIKVATYLINMMAAIAAAKLCDVQKETVQQVLNHFRGLPSRMEKYREVKGASYIDDSQCSNIGAAIWALNSFSNPVIWIGGGGIEKNANLEEIPQRIKRGKLKAILLTGPAGGRLGKILQGMAPIIETLPLSEAVSKAYEIAEPKDIVLYSPASPPDLFTQKPGSQRGEKFKKLVSQLKDTEPIKPKRDKFIRI